MDLFYQISNLNIKISTDKDISQSGFCNIFKADFVKPDVEIIVNHGEINRVGECVYSCERFDALFDKNSYSTIVKDRQFDKDIIIASQTDNKYFCTVNAQADIKTNDVFYIFNNVGLPHIMIENNRVMLHGSYIIHNDKAIVFSGKSGIGKSTQADLWKKFAGAEIINGDKTVLFAENGKLFASSCPIAGTSMICKNKTAEVSAIVFLDQAEENCVTNLSCAEKVGMLVSNSVYDCWRPNELSRLIDLCCGFFDKTKITKYSCLPNETAVDYLKAVIE